MGSEVSRVWRKALDTRSERCIRFAQGEWSRWSDGLLSEWSGEVLAVRERYPALSREECGWVSWARIRVGVSERRGYALDEYRRRTLEGREAAKPGVAA